MKNFDKMSSLQILKIARGIIPPLTSSLHKGQLGKIGVIGGCLEYTGAPFYAGISAMRAGADLVTVICSEEAGIPIKCYSPELIVYPVITLSKEMDSESRVNELAVLNIERVKKLFPRLDSIVIGPGAGRNPSMIQTLKGLILYALEIKKPLVVDGDGLWVLTQYPEIFSDIDFKTQNVILTPNQMEFTRLWNRVMNENRNPSDLTQTDEFVRSLSSALHGPAILQKGAIDRISDGSEVVCNDSPASLRRCGGQGDIVAGVAGLMNLWSKRVEAGEMSAAMRAAIATSGIVREAGRRAFEREKRRMTVMTVIEEVGETVEE